MEEFLNVDSNQPASLDSAIKGIKKLVIKKNQESSEYYAEFEAEDKKYYGNVISRLN